MTAPAGPPADPRLEGLWVRVLSTPDELHQAYRLRYDVFSAVGHSIHLDPERKISTDVLDRPGTIVLGAWMADQLVGSTRCSFRTDGPFIRDPDYPWDELSAMTGCTGEALHAVVGLVDRSVVAPEVRGRGLHGELLRIVEALAGERGVEVLLGIIHEDNQASMRGAERRGWRKLLSAGGWGRWLKDLRGGARGDAGALAAGD